MRRISYSAPLLGRALLIYKSVMGPRPKSHKPSALAPNKPRDIRPVFVRFVCFKTVDGQRFPLGLFLARDDARESTVSEPWALALLNDISDWFDTYLEAPDRFDSGKWGREGNSAICWFKPTATEHIQKMYDFKSAMEACGVHVNILTTRDVGQVLYEDEYQVAAIPNRHTF